MARLKMAPRKDVTTDLSSHTSDAEAEAATQQLLVETLASTSKPRQPQQSSAILGASLLNAARINDRHSSPAGMTGAGKLKRPSFVADEPPRKRLASRGNVYDIMSSPEKGAFKLPDTVNRQPLKVVRKKRKPQQEERQELGEDQRASSEPPASLDGDAGREDEEPHGAKSKDESRGRANNMKTRKTRKLEDAPDEDERPSKSSMSRVHEAVDVDGTRRAPSKAKARKDSRVPSRKTHPQVQIPVRAKGRQKETQGSVAKDNSRQIQDGEASETSEVAAPEQPVEGRPTRSKRQITNGTISSTQHEFEMQKTKDTTKALNKTQPAPEMVSTHSMLMDGQASSSESDANEEEFEEDDEEDKYEEDNEGEDGDEIGEDEGKPSEQHTDSSTGNDLDKVFKFLDIEERSGKCQSTFGKNIKRACQRSCALLQSKDQAIDSFIEDSEDIRSKLNRVSAEVSKDDRLAFKSDAYAYIFRGLTAHLEATYSWLSEKCESVLESLEAMRVLAPLTHDILAFKDTITRWKISVPQRYKGDRIVMDVESNLIVPLREVDKSFRVRLSQLEAVEQRRQRGVEMKLKLEEDANDERRIADAFLARRERWRRWQILHIARMQCEPDPRRRRHLVITRLEDIEERDANGDKFERVPLFKTRSTQPLHWASSMSEERVWTNDEQIALLNGLEEFAGMFTNTHFDPFPAVLKVDPGPRVFEEIFRTYCRAGGVLRDFNVTEIVTKSAWVRSDLIKLYQEKVWGDVPGWVKQIPVMF